MKTTILLLIGTLFCSAAIAQQVSFVYIYDSAGNRVKREVGYFLPSMPLNAAPGDTTMQTAQPEVTNTQSQTQNAPAFEVHLFPNPTHGLVTLELPELKTGETGQITVHSQMGALVFQQKYVTAAQSINLGNLLPGYYVVRVVVMDKMVLTGIIKQ